MTPYYDDGNGIVIYHGDCRDILPDLPVADLVLTDPPYGIDVCTKGGLKQRGYRPYDAKCQAHIWDAVTGDDEPFNPSHLLNIPNLILWGANNYANRLPDSACWFVFDKKAGKAADSSMGDCELAWVRGLPYKTVRMFTHMWAGFQRDSEVGERHIHPTQKPVALMAWCLEFFPQCKLVLDPYMGSGPILRAAKDLGRKCIGIEIEEQYCEIAARRLQQEVLDLRL